VLVFLGGELERLWGTRRYLTFFLGSGLVTGILYSAIAGTMGSSVAGGPALILGPMGPIYAMLVVYGILFAERTLHFMMLFPLKAKHFVWLLGGLEFMNTIFTPGGLYWGLANVSGMASGYLLLKGQVWWIRYRQKRMDLEYVRKKKKAQSNLRLVVNKDDPEERDGPGGPKTWH
jgi:membrane associated rhomboid family serine protease